MQGVIYTLFLKSSFVVASLLVRNVNEEKAQKERSYKAPTYMENLTPNLRSVGKTEMAHLYHPCDTVSDVAARRWLNRKIQQNEHLLTLLERNGYNKYSHTFTPIQVMLILNELGTPLSLISGKLIVTKSDILEVLGKK